METNKDGEVLAKIFIPFKTPTVNHLYGRNKFGSVYLKREAKKLHREIHEIVIKSKAEVPMGVLLHVSVEIYEDWFSKKGNVKIKDVANKEKFLVDSVFDALGIDDKMIFHSELKKVHSDGACSIITIREFKKEVEDVLGDS